MNKPIKALNIKYYPSGTAFIKSYFSMWIGDFYSGIVFTCGYCRCINNKDINDNHKYIKCDACNVTNLL